MGGSEGGDRYSDALRGSLPWVTGGFAALLGVRATSLVTAGPEGATVPLGIAAAVLALVLGAVALLSWRGRLTRVPPEILLVAALGALTVVELAAMAATQDAERGYGVLVVLVAAGTFLLSVRWLVATLYAVWVGWVAVVAALGIAHWDFDRVTDRLLAMVAVTVLAVLVHRVRLKDVDATSLARRQADEASVRDPLTGLVNRRGLTLLGAQMVEVARRQGDAVHCMFVDVDQLKHVNDTLGMPAGDDVIVAVADALRSVTRGTDVVARWGGDEFCVIGPGPGMAPIELERRVRDRLSISPPVAPDVWSPSVGAGGAMLAPWDSGSLDTLLGKADQEMYLRRALRKERRPRPPVEDKQAPG